MAKITSLKINNVDYELSSNSILEITKTTTMQEVYDAAMNGCTTLHMNEGDIGGYFYILGYGMVGSNVSIFIGIALIGWTIIEITASPDSVFTTNMEQNSDTRNTYGFVCDSSGYANFIDSNDITKPTRIHALDPEDDQDVTTKSYVDTQIASVKPSVQKIEGLVIEPAEQYGWINRSADILVDLYIGEDAIGYPEMYGSIKIPITQGQSDYADDYMRGSYFNTRYKTNNDLYKLKDLLSDYGYIDRPYTVVFLAAQAVSPNSIGFFTWCDDSYNISESSIFGVGFTPGGAVYDDETYLTLVPKLIRL